MDVSCQSPDSYRPFRSGFTLVEIMVVVVVLGLLSAIALPVLGKVRDSALNSRIASDFRSFKNAFEQFALENGAWPENAKAGDFPPEMEGYISQSQFETTVTGDAVWDWQGPWNGVYGVSLYSSNLRKSQMVQVDALVDDGDLSNGDFRLLGSSHYTWIFDEE